MEMKEVIDSYLANGGSIRVVECVNEFIRIHKPDGMVEYKISLWQKIKNWLK